MAAEDGGPQEDQILARARAMFEAGDDAGVLDLADVLSADGVPSRRGEGLRLCGLAALRQGRNEVARMWLDKARPLLGDDDVGLSVALGGACLAGNAAGTAEVHFRRALSRAPHSAGACVGLALALERLNDRSGALAAWRQAMAALVALAPASTDSWMLALAGDAVREPVLDLALKLRQAGASDRAVDLLSRLGTLAPHDPDIMVARVGDAPRRGGADGDGALAGKNRSGAEQYGADQAGEPADGDATGPHVLMNQARDAHRGGKAEEARSLFRKAGRMAVRAPSPLDEGLVSLALAAADALRQLGDGGGASGLLDDLARHRPDDPEVVRQRALAMHAAGRAAEALTLVEEAEARHGGTSHGPLLLVHASLLRRAGRLDEAAGVCRRASLQAPRDAEPLRLLAQVLEDDRRADEALAACHAALLRNPDLAWCHGLIGRILDRRNQIDPAVEHQARAVDIQPDSGETHLALALLLLKRGDWVSGWDEYEWRVLKTDRPADSFMQPPWEGERLDGDRLLVWHERQGVVEELMFLRLARAAARAAGGGLVLEVDERLAPLLARGMPEVTVVTFSDPPDKETRAGDIAAQVPFGSLARFVAPEPSAIGDDGPTLVADPGRVAALRAAYLDGRAGDLLVGICWKPLNAKRRVDRVVPLPDWAPVFEVGSVRFVSVQAGPARADVEQLTKAGGPEVLVDPDIDGTRDLEGLSAQIAAMDLVITVDALSAHLAGSLGVPGILLLPFSPDWRWGLSGIRTPWYPSLRLARQTVPEDWSGPLRRAAAALRGYRKAASRARGAS